MVFEEARSYSMTVSRDNTNLFPPPSPKLVSHIIWTFLLTKATQILITTVHISATPAREQSVH